MKTSESEEATSRSARQTPSVLAEDQPARTEVIFRIEPHGKYLRCVHENQITEQVMINYTPARGVIDNRGGFKNILEPYQTLTISGTEKDELTLNRSRYDVIDLFIDSDRSFRYVPDWSWVYGTSSAALDAVDRYVGRVEWLYEEAESLGLLDKVEFIPLVKGVNPSHFERAIETYQQLGINRVAVYVAQTRSFPEIKTRVGQVISTNDPEGVLVIGRGAPHEISQLPDRVDGIASLRNWKKEANLTASGYSPEKLRMWKYKNEIALASGSTDVQTGLNSFYSETGVKIDG